MNDAVAIVTHDFSKEILRWKLMLQAYASSVLGPIRLEEFGEICMNLEEFVRGKHCSG